MTGPKDILALVFKNSDLQDDKIALIFELLKHKSLTAEMLSILTRSDKGNTKRRLECLQKHDLIRISTIKKCHFFRAKTNGGGRL